MLSATAYLLCVRKLLLQLGEQGIGFTLIHNLTIACFVVRKDDLEPYLIMLRLGDDRCPLDGNCSAGVLLTQFAYRRNGSRQTSLSKHNRLLLPLGYRSAV